MNMYHIPNDKRAIISAERLYEGLIESSKHKKLEEISISQLAESSKVGRATFYRLFDNPSDILYWKCEKILSESIDKAESGGSKQEAFYFFGNSLLKNKDMLSCLIENNRLDILSNAHEASIKRIQEVFFSDLGLEKLQEEYLAYLLAGIIPAAFKIYGKHKEITSEKLFLDVRDSLSLMIKLFS